MGETTSAECFANNLIVEDILHKASVGKKQPKFKIPDAEFFEVIWND